MLWFRRLYVHIHQPFKTIEVRCQTNYILGLSDSGKLHWRYSIYAIRCFRTLVRRDVPLQGAHMQYFLKNAHDDHPMMVSFLFVFRNSRRLTGYQRYVSPWPQRGTWSHIHILWQYAQRAIMKSVRFLKLRTCCTRPEDLALMRNLNPLNRIVSVKPHQQTTLNFLNAYKIPVNMSIAGEEPWVYFLGGDCFTQPILKFVLRQRSSRLAHMGQKC